ncbi:uncharacterized protein V6R79_001401 [Siganus canaliculatus]
MASLLKDPLFETSDLAPPPSRDFYYFAVTKADVIWRCWKISPRAVYRFSRPEERRESHQDFLDDTRLQSDVTMIFGRRVLLYCRGLCEGCYDYLEQLPDSLLLRIINYLELEDVGQLGRTSRRFKRLCESERFWEQAVRRHCETVSAEVESLALEEGWRRIFFTSKLQLQKLISRRRLKTKDQQDPGEVSEPDLGAEGSPEDSSGSGSEEDSHTVSSLSLSAFTVADFDCNESPGSSPGSSPEPEAAGDYVVAVTDQSKEDVAAKPDKTLS